MGDGAAGPSLKARAVAVLARREHTALELRRKLRRFSDSEAEIDEVIGALRAAGYLSDQRFAQARTQARSGKYGTSRILAELRSLGVPDDVRDAQAAGLAASELSRAKSVVEKRIGAKDPSTLQFQREMRFLLARGFPASIAIDALRSLGVRPGAGSSHGETEASR